MAKLKVELGGALLEVEGEEVFIKEIYGDFKQRLNEKDSNNTKDAEKPQKEGEAASSGQLKGRSSGARITRSKGSGRRKESYEIVKDLDLSNKGSRPGLKEFCTQKGPSNAMETNAVSVYYLQKLAHVKNIGPNHIYTCYKHLDRKVPTALKQSLLDTAFHKGWLDTGTMTNITVTIVGENFVEHEMKPKDAKK